MRRLRWRLARLIAPMPIIADPGGEAEDKVFLLIREGPAVVWFRATSLDLQMENSVMGPAGGTFSGTLGRVH